MTARELRKILKVVADDTEITVGKFAIKRIIRSFENHKMLLMIIPGTPLIAAPSDTLGGNK